MASKTLRSVRPSRVRRDDRGTAMVIALMVMGLLSVFAAAALSRVTTEARLMGNDYEQTRAFYAAQASLEQMTKDFSKIFITQFSPTQANVDTIAPHAPKHAAPTSHAIHVASAEIRSALSR